MYHRVSEMKAILLAGVTSIHNFPVRTTGPDCQKHVRNRWIQDFLHSCRHFYTRISDTIKERKYLRLALISVDNGYSAQELASLLDGLTLYFCPTWLRKIGFEVDNLAWLQFISGGRVTVRIISSGFNVRTQTLLQDQIPSPSQRSRWLAAQRWEAYSKALNLSGLKLDVTTSTALTTICDFNSHSLICRHFGQRHQDTCI